jgi:hypothetical protein
MEPKIPLYGLDLQSELSIAQFVIPAGAGGLYAVTAANIATITFNAAHGLTLTPAANVPANYFIGFGGSTSGLTGTGILVGNIFRILAIPSTTTIQIYSTITAATVTSLTGIPVFLPPFSGSAANQGVGGPTQTVATVTTVYPPANVGQCAFNCLLGANCAVSYNSDGTFIPLDPTTGNTPAVAPVFRAIIAASGSGQVVGTGASIAVFANGTTATSRISVHN